MDKIAWRWISYDVWGNETDGWEVNAAYTTSVVYRISEDATDETILKTIWEDDADKVKLEWSSVEDTIFFSAKETSEPLGEIRRIEK
jgi:hypothetical protein